MKEIALLDPSKETDNKLRWIACDDSGVLFKLYIPKGRVPTPWPVRILVRIDDDPASLRSIPPQQPPKPPNHRDLRKPIIALVKRTPEKHTETVQYQPLGKPRFWELGEPYIPFSMLAEPPPERLRIDVEWDFDSGS